MIPIFIYYYVNAAEAKEYYAAALIILLSGLTDMFDGLIARKFDQITELGKIVDPIADKLTQMAIIICLLVSYPYVWILITLFVFKELFMGINGLVLLKKGKKLDGAMWFGKVSTAVFYGATFLLIAFPEINPEIAAALMGITGACLTLSFILYIPEFIKLHHHA